MKVECQAKPNFGIVFIYQGAARAMVGRARGPQLCDFVVKHRTEPELWLSYSDSWFEFGHHHSIGHCSSFYTMCTQALSGASVIFGKNVGNESGNG